MYLQDAYGLEASESPLGDVADGVVPQTQGVEIPQHGQTAFIQTSQVVVRQIPGESDTDRKADKEKERERERGKKEGGRKKNVLCEVWKEMTGWQKIEAARDIIILKFHG